MRETGMDLAQLHGDGLASQSLYGDLESPTMLELLTCRIQALHSLVLDFGRDVVDGLVAGLNVPEPQSADA
mgnify:CR=1 FL=1